MIATGALTLEAGLLDGVVAAVAGASTTGLLEALAAAEVPARDLASATGLDPEAVERVLLVLAELGLAERWGEGWIAGPLLRALDADSPGGLAATLDIWRGVADYLRTGRHRTWSSGAATERASRYRPAVDHLGRYFERSAEELADRAGPAREILDVGAGSGVWSLEMARRDPGARVAGLDLPEVCPAFLGRACALGLGDRVHAIVGSYHDVPLETGRFDRIVVANVLRLEPAPAARALLRRLSLALAAGGTLVVVDVPDSGPATRALARAVYRLHLALRSDAGGPHPEERIIAWLAEAGLARVERIDLATAPLGEVAWIARRSASPPPFPRGNRRSSASAGVPEPA